MTLVLGASGQLGRAFAARIPQATLWTRSDLDLRNLDEIGPALSRLEPELLINCAAYNAVDRAESDEDTATAVNAHAVAQLARYAAQTGARLVTFSSDYVFDGTGRRPRFESDPTGPVNAYGRSKLRGERAALEAHPETLVIRTSWLVSGSGPDFVTRVLDRARRGPVSVVDDQWGCPTIAGDLADATLAALAARARGLLHVTNEGITTWYRLAVASAEIAGLDPASIRPCSTEEYPRAAPRPVYSVLGSERRAGLGLPVLDDWKRSLAAEMARPTDRP